MICGIFGAVLVGAIVGYASERMGFTRNGYIVSCALGVGGAVILLFAQYMFGFSLGFNRGLTSVIGAVAVLFLAGRQGWGRRR